MKKKIKDLTFKEFKKMCEKHIFEYGRYGDCDKCQLKDKKCGEIGTYLAKKEQLKEYVKAHGMGKILEQEIEVDSNEEKED